MAEPLIRDVSDTAFWIAQHRAQESARADALFRDPLAGLLAGERGPAIAAAMPHARVIGWSVAIRTRIIDDFIRCAVGEGVDTVLNLGAGLDTRPYRMDLPASLRWIEADYPHVVEYKENRLAQSQPRCALERVRIDLAGHAAREQLLTRVDAQANRILVLTEGLIPYLALEEVALLARDLRAMQHVRCWLVDYFSAEATRYRRRSGMNRSMQNAPFRFAPDDWFGFFREQGWQAMQVRYLAEEGDRLQRPIPLPWPWLAMTAFWKLVAPRQRWETMRRFAGYVRLEPC